MRSIAGLIAGLVAAAAAMIAVGFVGNLFVPMSDAGVPGMGEALIVALAAGPLGPQVTVLAAWFFAAFAGAAAARYVSRAAWPGWTIAGLLALLLAGAFLVPLPIWMQVLAVLGPLGGGLLADRLVDLPRADGDAVGVHA